MTLKSGNSCSIPEGRSTGPTVDQSWLSKQKKKDGGVASSKARILRKIEKFCGQLYTSVTQPVGSSVEVLKAEFT
ncbi:unnamed protein product [Euphydryas editha]|uniref:Uncharacterized protein n=1 Tax=Euphydryas editha TaxID=104508 RepID=A0AAU9UHB1_EUPED|nr:unnamed protein product [Euphydryas editha]